MPAQVLTRDRRHQAPPFAVIGMYSPLETGFVQHVALVADKAGADLEYGRDVEVWHMGPPLVAGPQSRAAACHEQCRCPSHLVAWADLTSEERDGMRHWLAEVDDEMRPHLPHLQYIAHPPLEWVTDEVTGIRRFRRFSCSGFVISCYREGAGLNVLSQALPPVELPTLMQVYGSQHLSHVRRRLGIGLLGTGPWQVVLPGYILHAFNRPTPVLRLYPYQPGSAAEAQFP